MLKGLERLSTHPAVIAAIVTAIATFGGGIGASWITSKISEDQLEANLIVEAVKVCTKDQAINNIRTLIDAGFLPQHSKRLNAILGSAFDKLIPSPNCSRHWEAKARSGHSWTIFCGTITRNLCAGRNLIWLLAIAASVVAGKITVESGKRSVAAWRCGSLAETSSASSKLSGAGVATARKPAPMPAGEKGCARLAEASIGRPGLTRLP
jgi:hypothetical protein